MTSDPSIKGDGISLDDRTAESITVVPLSRVGSKIAAGIVIGLIAVITYVVGSSQQVEWAQIPEFIFNPAILMGVVETLKLTAMAMIIGSVLGTVLAVMRMSDQKLLRAFSVSYVFFFRGVPLLVQLLFWFNIALFIPEVGFGSWTVSTNLLVTAQVAGLLALSMHEAANMAEIVRNGFLAVDKGQEEACLALGLTPLQAATRIVLPQAIRTIIPPAANQAIGLLKGSSIVCVIGSHDLLTEVQNTYARNYMVIELLFVAAIWYLVLTAMASVGQHYLERYFGQKEHRLSSLTRDEVL
ncbi:MAG: amino acid ABC transporter permease [Novosphingobium sp.]